MHLDSQKHNVKRLRATIRQRRQALTVAEQAHAAQQLVNQICQDELYLHCTRAALYLTNDGEIDTSQVIEQFWRDSKFVALPVMHPFSQHHMLFVHYDKNTTLFANRFGIPEPRVTPSQICLLSELNIIFTPLVAFDQAGSRMGMGGGFYDRALAQLQQENPRCRIIGLAHDCQEVTQLEKQSWDMPMDEIITPTRHIMITPRP